VFHTPEYYCKAGLRRSWAVQDRAESRLTEVTRLILVIGLFILLSIW
jgi:hypothetical protein